MTAGAGALCRDCGWLARGLSSPPDRCPTCRTRRVLRGPDLFDLVVAHVDCDAFYASVEKRDRPELAHRPLIVGGGRRGVVTTACYIARISGVRSAMPMFKALALCPEAVVVKPDMPRYVEASRAIRAKLLTLTPLVEPLSLDEAFLDLAGTERLHGAPPAAQLAALAREVEADVGVSISVGLAPNKFLAKIASDLDKPRGFSVISRAAAPTFLHDRPVSAIWGVGAAMAERLGRDGFATVGDLARADASALAKRYGALGLRLADLANGRDTRRVTPGGLPKSVSAETTFETDLADADTLAPHLWRLCERVSDRLKAKELAGRVATLKLKTAAFRTTTKRRTLPQATQLADTIYRAAAPLLDAALRQDRRRYRLIGVGLSDLTPARPDSDLATDLLDPAAPKRAAAERAVDRLRGRFGRDVIAKGRGWSPE